jgi:monofunctional biosynthetic peptidoglycan transglycosylase
MFNKIIWGCFVALFLYFGSFLVYPNVGKLKMENPVKTAFMEYREKEWQREGKNTKIKRQWVPLSRISPYLIKAVIIAEDDKFYQHEGFDFEAIQKAMEKDLKEGKFKVGGSTISQQLAKNLFLSPSKNPIRKLKEAILTWRLERALPKKRIMELYLNVVEWGEGIFGIEAAARNYYGKPASALGPEESARLAAVLPNPRKHNPLSQSKFVVHRSRIFYNLMVRRGIVIPAFEEVMAPELKNEGLPLTETGDVPIPPAVESPQLKPEDSPPPAEELKR